MASAAELFVAAQAHHTAGRLAKAKTLYRELLEIQPDHADALNMLGTLLAQEGNAAAAAPFIHRAIALKPGRAPFHNNLGVVQQSLKHFDQARRQFQRAMKLDPDYADPIYNLANLYKQLDQPEAAFFTYLRVLDVDPERADAMINLGNLLFDKGENGDAVESFRKALAASADDRTTVRAAINLGNTYRRLGEVKDALTAYDTALAIAPHDGLAIKRALTLPVVTRSWDDIRDVREAYEDRVRALLARPLKVTDPALETSTTTFFLAYHGLGDRALQELVAELHLKACPGLAETAPHCENPKPPTGRIKLGFVSAYFRLHSVGRLMRGLIEGIDKDAFDITVFTMPGQGDPVARAIAAAADNVVRLPTGLPEARAAIAEAEQDILFHADIGMDIRTYFLAFARLAPVQCVTWGHPDTTGIPNLDYFLSSELIEPDSAEAEYSEALVRLPTLPTAYLAPELPTLKDRDGLGLPVDRRLYFCPQSTQKHHPDLDLLIGGILRADGDGEVLLLEGAVREWTASVRARMETTIPDIVERVRVIPRVPPDDFLSLLAAADVIVDPPHWSGGNTSYEAFAVGTPVVAHAGQFMRGRVTLGMYAKMGIADAIGETPEACAEIAVALGTDADRRADLARRIAANREVLYGETAAIRAFEAFFKEKAAAIG